MKTHPNGATYINAYIALENVDQTLDFYEKAFGFEIIEKVPGEDGKTWHAEAKHYGQLVMFGKAGAWECKTETPRQSGVESPITLYLYVDDVDQFYEHALQHGAVTEFEPQDMFWGDRMCSLRDPEGYLWNIAPHK